MLQKRSFWFIFNSAQIVVEFIESILLISSEEDFHGVSTVISYSENTENKFDNLALTVTSCCTVEIKFLYAANWELEFAKAKKSFLPSINTNLKIMMFLGRHSESPTPLQHSPCVND